MTHSRKTHSLVSGLWVSEKKTGMDFKWARVLLKIWCTITQPVFISHCERYGDVSSSKIKFPALFSILIPVREMRHTNLRTTFYSFLWKMMHVTCEFVMKISSRTLGIDASFSRKLKYVSCAQEWDIWIHEHIFSSSQFRKTEDYLAQNIRPIKLEKSQLFLPPFQKNWLNKCSQLSTKYYFIQCFENWCFISSQQKKESCSRLFLSRSK